MKTNCYNLIYRHHVDSSKNRFNSFNKLSRHLNEKITQISPQKGLLCPKKDLNLIKKRVNDYNKSNHTDFMVE